MPARLFRKIKARFRPLAGDYSDAELAALAERLAPHLLDRLAPHLAQRLTAQPRYWGDPSRVRLGRHVHVTNTLFNIASGDIVVEDFVFFGHDVSLLTGTHDISRRDLERQSAVPEEGRDIVIRRGAWIASGVTVVGPAEIGEHAVICPGSVVIGDVPAGWVYAGSPARAVKPCPAAEPAASAAGDGAGGA